MRDLILAYAAACLEYDAGSGYGHTGDAPAHDHLSWTQAECVRGSLSCGRRAGSAQADGDQSRIDLERQQHTKHRFRARQLGVAPAVMDEVYALGYRSTSATRR